MTSRSLRKKEATQIFTHCWKFRTTAQCTPADRMPGYNIRQMKRKLLERIQDRLWREMGRFLIMNNPPSIDGAGNDSGSISSSMPWVALCANLADGKLDSRNFRRMRAVRQIVETVGPVDAKFYASRIREWGQEWLHDSGVHALDGWGDPVRLPGWYLGTPRPFSPTTLRYLATALWLKRKGLLADGDEVAEIGVGFGGLAAMNGLISGTRTMLVDLPQVESAAMRMLHECKLTQHAAIDDAPTRRSIPLVISNYAFTELNGKLQELYMDEYLKHAKHGLIISNAAVFARTIGGRSDEELLDWFRAEGLDAHIDPSDELLCPSDRRCQVSMIHW
jgi:hypothetical protein